jgi:8-amino-7-oxononanoate synthase
MNKIYQQKIEKLKSQNLYRSLSNIEIIDETTLKKNQKKLINFASNDYFNLSQNKLVKKAAINAIEKYGVGATSSRYIVGNNSLYQKLEKIIAEEKKCDDAIVFSSGYSCAIGVIPALVDNQDLIIADRLIHSCLIDAAKLSSARLMRFLHNDISHAREILMQNRAKFKKCLIITETIFSMDGDLGLVDDLKKLAIEFDCLIIADDAHGIFDDEVKNNQKNSKNSANFIVMGTLSKAIGCLGGYVATNSKIIDYLRNFAKSQIYSTALPPSILAAAIKSFEIIKKTRSNAKSLAKKTLANAQYFCDLANLPKPDSAIVVIIIGNEKETINIAKKIEENGFLVSAIRAPTVEKNKARLRITFCSANKKSDIKKLAKIISKISIIKPDNKKPNNETR